ncbi:hypothetical protein ONA70_02820 [Micromonospora yasonensis]|nr:hypothetical protein [Micromonospora yasonensis]MCW3839030.1 hypothetical protein [Micromonospora yasonensis]
MVELVTAAVDQAAGRWEGLVDRVRRLGGAAATFAAASLDSRLLHGALLTAMGPTEEAVDLLVDVIAVAERVGAVWPLIPARTTLSRLLLTLDDAAGAAEHAGAALTQVRAKGNWVWGAEPVLCLVDALHALGRGGEAAELVDELAAGITGADAPLARAALLIAQAVVARSRDQWGHADRLLDAAHSVLKGAGLRYEEALAAERLGRLRCEREAADGGRLLESALRLYGAMHADRDIARICRIMRRNGAPIPYPWRGGRPSLGQTLSSRERKVALLAAEGKTNQEIASSCSFPGAPSRATSPAHCASSATCRERNWRPYRSMKTGPRLVR